jgi:hypothetical protein
VMWSVLWPRLELLWRLSVILGLADNMEERLAKKLGVASVVVDVAQKDRLAIMSYQATMPANPRDWFYAENALRNSNAKWRN